MCLAVPFHLTTSTHEEKWRTVIHQNAFFIREIRRYQVTKMNIGPVVALAVRGQSEMSVGT